MSVDVEVPQPFNANLGLSGEVGIGLEEVNIDLKSVSQVNTDSEVDLKSDSKIDLASNSKIDLKSDNELEVETDSKVELNSDSNVDLGLDNVGISIRELPNIIFGFRPTRVQAPHHYKVCLKLFGVEIFKFESCGEGMLISEDLKKRAAEKCEEEKCK